MHSSVILEPLYCLADLARNDAPDPLVTVSSVELLGQSAGIRAGRRNETGNLHLGAGRHFHGFVRTISCAPSH